jgi:TRAP-type C4-dicarboxylate transport system permease small subunit
LTKFFGALIALSRALNYVATAAAMLLTAFIVLSSVVRYLLGAPFRFTEELVGLFFITMCFLAIPLGLLERRHVTITVFTQLLGRRGRLVCEMLATIIVVAFATVFVIESYKFTALSFRLGARSEVGNLLLYPWMALMPLTMALVVLVVIAQLVKLIHDGGEVNPPHDTAGGA